MPREKKYAALARTLPRLNQVSDASYQQRVQVVRDALAENGGAIEQLLVMAVTQLNEAFAKVSYKLGYEGAQSSSNLGKVHLALRDVSDATTAFKSAVNLVEEAVEQQLIDTLLDEDVDSLSITGTGKNISSSPEPYPQVKDSEALRRWVDEDTDLRLSMQLPYKTLEGLVKRMLLDGKAVPPGVEVYIRDRIRVT